MNIHEKNFKKEEKLENTIVKKERSGNVTSRNTTINQELLRKILMKDNDEYTKKINLGSSIYRIIRENKIKLESLRTVYKEALELFVKQRFVDLSIVFKQYKCDLCSEAFKRKWNLERHVGRYHRKHHDNASSNSMIPLSDNLPCHLRTHGIKMREVDGINVSSAFNSMKSSPRNNINPCDLIDTSMALQAFP